MTILRLAPFAVGPLVLAIFRLLRHSRLAVVLLIVYQALFLNVFVPSHTPAVVTVDGSASVHACCHDESQEQPKKQDDAPDRSRCAVCNLVARLAPATTIDLKLPEHGLIEVLPVLPPHLAVSATPLPPYLGRGPPADRPTVA